MTKLFVTILIVFSSAVFAQKVEKLFNEEKFKELTGLENESPSFTGEELYYLGFAFFREENDDKAIEYYNKALKKVLIMLSYIITSDCPKCIRKSMMRL